MPETSDDGLPGQQSQLHATPGQDPADPSPAAPKRRPAWRRRGVLITGIVAVAAAATTAVVLWPSSRPEGYTALPPPCTLVTAATVAKYVPGTTSKPLGPSVPGGCDWHGTSGSLGQRDLVVVAAVFSSSSGVTLARQLFNLDAHTTISTPHHEITFTVIRRPVPGLGDQAVVQIFQPGKNVVPQLPVIEVDVRSRNAEFSVTFNVDLPGAQPPPSGPELVLDTVAIARNILAVLASPETA